MSDDLTSKIEKDRSEPSQRSAVPRIDDVMIYMFVSNLHDGKVWANYQLLKDFFTSLQHGPKWWTTAAVKEMIDRIVIHKDINHALTRIMGSSGFLYICEVGNDYLYADAERAEMILGEHFSRLPAGDQAAFMEISQRYGALLKKIGR